MELKPNPPVPLDTYTDVGDAVYWYAGGNRTLAPLVGIVIERSPGGGPNSANLTIATFTGSGFAVQEGVLHMSHPNVRRPGRHGGGWAHRPLDLLFRKFLYAMGAMLWDGNESYVANPEFNPDVLGGAMSRMSAAAAGSTLTFKSPADAQAAAKLFMESLEAKDKADVDGLLTDLGGKKDGAKKPGADAKTDPPKPGGDAKTDPPK